MYKTPRSTMACKWEESSKKGKPQAGTQWQNAGGGEQTLAVVTDVLSATEWEFSAWLWMFVAKTAID